MKFLAGSILPALVFLAAPIQALAAPLTFHVAVAKAAEEIAGQTGQPISTVLNEALRRTLPKLRPPAIRRSISDMHWEVPLRWLAT